MVVCHHDIEPAGDAVPDTAASCDGSKGSTTLKTGYRPPTDLDERLIAVARQTGIDYVGISLRPQHGRDVNPFWRCSKWFDRRLHSQDRIQGVPRAIICSRCFHVATVTSIDRGICRADGLDAVGMAASDRGHGRDTVPGHHDQFLTNIPLPTCCRGRFPYRPAPVGIDGVQQKPSASTGAR